MQNFVKRLKAFNTKHRKLVPVLIYFELIAIVFVSIFGYIKKHIKGAALAVATILAVVVAVMFLSNKNSRANVAGDDLVAADTSVSVAEAVVTEAIAEEAVAGEASFTEETEVAVEAASEATTVEMTEAVEAASEDTSEEAVETVSEVVETIVPEIVDTVELGVGTGKAVSQEEFDQFVKKYNDTVGWLWFEDERLNYPIMRAEDNNKYALKDYAGNDSDTGAIFLDYRNARDFSDSNSIIYGHNMRNRTMFGALKIYKEDLGFLELHKYFQIITSEGRSRYQIFAFMDVPKDSYIYDVIGKNPSNMREYLDTIEYKTYIDTGIEPTVDDQIVMLSSCTKSDELYFVIFGVKVD